MDIVERLRDGCECKFTDADCLAQDACRECMEAADEIERLREKLKQWEDSHELVEIDIQQKDSE